jgi:Yip1 domain
MDLVERVKAILLTPKTEWPVIAREPGDVAYLFKNYVAILAAIPAVCGLIGAVIAGAPIGAALLLAILRYLLTFVIVYVVALIVDALAPTFGSQKSMDNALKLTVYSATPVWVAGIFLLIPSLSFLTFIASLYGLYLMWLGLPPLMKTPEDKSVLYVVAVFVALIVVSLIIGAIMALIGLRLLF